MKFLTLVMIAVSSVFVAQVAEAEPSAETLVRTYEAANPEVRGTLDAMLAYTYNGMEWANTAVAGEPGGKPIYCPPEKIVLTGQQLEDMLRRASAAKSYIAKEPLGLALLMTLKDDFPCH